MVVMGRLWVETLRSQPVAIEVITVPPGSTASDVLKALHPSRYLHENDHLFFRYIWSSCMFSRVNMHSLMTRPVLSMMGQKNRGDTVIERITIPEGITVSSFLHVYRHTVL